MSHTPPDTLGSSPSLVDTPVHRASRRNQGLPPEHGLLESARAPTHRPVMPAAAYYTLQNPRLPKPFHGSQLEDVEDWLLEFERVASFNQWDDAAKLRNVFFSLEDGARTWYENREDALTSWHEFRRRLLETYTSTDRRERAERALQSRIQMPNETVSMCVEDMTRLFRRADPAMPEDKKVRHLMRGVKEQLFAGLVRSPPGTVAEFLSEAVTMEKMLLRRSTTYDRPVLAASLTEPLPAFGANPGLLRDLILSVVREELQALFGAPLPTAGSLASLVREEVQALRPSFPSVDPPPLPTECRRPTYAEALQRPAPSSAQFPPSNQGWLFSAHPDTYYIDNRRSPQRKTDLWRAPDRRRLCFHCGEPGHLYRQCPYRQLGLQGFPIDMPRPPRGQRPREIEDYVAQQRMTTIPQRQSRSPSPR
ncbi:uncharacterized protein LOC144094341 [Amblyomma americanum]